MLLLLLPKKWFSSFAWSSIWKSLRKRNRSSVGSCARDCESSSGASVAQRCASEAQGWAEELCSTSGSSRAGAKDWHFGLVVKTPPAVYAQNGAAQICTSQICACENKVSETFDFTHQGGSCSLSSILHQCHHLQTSTYISIETLVLDTGGVGHRSVS